MKSINKPSKKYLHVFAVIRVDTFHDSSTHVEDKITVTKIFRTQESAEQEVERLNKLNAQKGSIYFWKITRLETSDKLITE